jgi:hypothetical protein
MIEYTEIELLYNLVRSVRKYCETNGKPLPVVEFEGTVKIHGTNGGIRITPSGKIRPQARTRLVSIGSDNYGFAAFVEKNRDSILDMWKKYWPSKDVYIYGEWAGEGIQKNIAVSQLGKHFIIFDIMVDGEYIQNKPEYSIEPNSIYNILRIPTYHVTIDFSFPEKSQDYLSEILNGIEAECPWAKQFGVSGIGEGIVFRSVNYPVRLIFKIKGTKHANKDTSKPTRVEVNIEKMKNIHSLVEALAPEWRLEQAITEIGCGDFLDRKKIGEFLKWISKDILKEESNRIADSGLEWKEVTPHLMTYCRNWFLKKMEFSEPEQS